ncbi:1-phosphofructokinase [Peptacetobacter sp.]|uniref:1-phosphofructokinase n=1 Tax=Peptacetobacter sp. TaxID=2991975 RepID=UPI0026054421|nr:1-phosphofructokinase [Peptacetobacter sp.]
MITTITFNPSIDRMYRVDEINIGEVQRVKSTNATAGGKGLNVTKVCKILGEDPVAIGFLGGFNGKYIKNELDKKEIKNQFTEINSETRNCLNIIDESKVSTEFLEKGPVIELEELSKFENDLNKVIKDTKVLAASGSLCQNMPVDYYAKIGNICKENNVKFILDTSGESLKSALKSKPYLIKPNTDEIKQLLAIDINSQEEIVSAGKQLLDMGAENVCISLGKNGMIYISKDVVYEVKIPTVEAINTVGSGDSTIAGFSVATLRGYDLEESIRLANACGISNALNIDTGFVKIEEVEKYKKLVEIKIIG